MRKKIKTTKNNNKNNNLDRNPYPKKTLREKIKPIFEKRFLEMLQTQEEYDKLVDYLSLPQRKSFRINAMKIKNEEKFIKNLKNKGLKLEKVPWSKGAYYVEYQEGKRIDLGNLYEHFKGEIYVQESTSMTPPELLEIPQDIPKNFTVLDMASSPGSKTTQIGIMMKNRGLLVANELDYRRIGPLKINLERSGLTNIIITNLDGTKFEGKELFDRILLDAPCSGSGVIRKSPGTIKTYNPKRLKSLHNLQLKLLQRAFELLKSGAIMTYSTCSMDPEENEFVVQKFLKNNQNASLEQANLKGIILNNKLTKFKTKEIDPQVTEKTCRIWPQDNNTNGFYVAKIKKLG